MLKRDSLYRSKKYIENHRNTVDGRNPAPVARLYIPIIYRVLYIAGTVPCVYHVCIFFPDGSAVSVAKTREFLPRSPIQWIQCIGACVKSIMQAISTLDSHN